MLALCEEVSDICSKFSTVFFPSSSCTSSCSHFFFNSFVLSTINLTVVAVLREADT